MGNPSTMQWAPKIPQKMTRDLDDDIYRHVQKNIKDSFRSGLWNFRFHFGLCRFAFSWN